MTAVALAFEEEARIPAVAQDATSGEVLMLAYVTEAAVERTRETGYAHYYSRSREDLWKKGESSGHVQEVSEIRVDCDGDALLYLVDQDGGACHTGYRTCFYRTIDGEVVGEKVFDPDDVYDEHDSHGNDHDKHDHEGNDPEANDSDENDSDENDHDESNSDDINDDE